MERKEKRQQAVRDAKIEVILQGAHEAFSKLGFHQTRLEDIAGAAGFSKTALYYYYNNKEEIFMDLGIRESRRVLGKIRRAIADTTTTLDAVLGYGKCILEIFGEHFNLMISMMDFEAGTPPNPEQFHKYKEKMKAMKRTIEEFEQMMVSLLKEGRKKGEVTVEIDETILSVYINAIFRGVMFRWGKEKKPGNLSAELDNLRRFLEPVLSSGCFQEK